MIEITLNLSRRLSLWLVWIGGSLIVCSAFLVTIEVFLRKFFNISIGGADELSGYAFGVATSLGLAYALHERAHIRVDALYLVLPKSLQVLTNIFGITLLIGFAGIISWMAWGLVNDTLQYGSRSITPMRTPLAIPQLPWLFGWLFFVFTGAVILITALVRLLSADLQGFDRLVGIKSIEDQIEDESTL